METLSSGAIDAILHPEPGKDIEIPSELFPLTPESRMPPKRALETIARQFRREFGYDFVQYCALEKDEWSKTRSFLWAEPDWGSKYRVIGGCCFRYRQYQNIPEPFWVLQWIWIHPYRRNKGLLTAAWPAFCALMECFAVEPPLSPAISGFLSDKLYRELPVDEWWLKLYHVSQATRPAIARLGR
jgi:hypothetical protein